jgi:hypothetical protein
MKPNRREFTLMGAGSMVAALAAPSVLSADMGGLRFTLNATAGGMAFFADKLLRFCCAVSDSLSLLRYGF